METSAVTNDNIRLLTVKLGRQICLAPPSIRKRSKSFGDFIGVLDDHFAKKIGTQCVHVSAIWNFNDHMGKKAMKASRKKDICVLCS